MLTDGRHEMKMKFLAATLVAVLLSLGQNESIGAPLQASTYIAARKQRGAEPPRPPRTGQRPLSGVVPRALRGHNPLQLFNPHAPAIYGTAEENVMTDPDDPGKWKGIKLFSISF